MQLDLMLDTAVANVWDAVKKLKKQRWAGKISCGVVGGAMGTMAGIVAVPGIMALNTIAPISYPLLGFAQGVVFPCDGPKEQLLCGGIGAIVGTVAIPLAPLDFISAPVRVPAYGFVVGTTLGVLTGHFVIDKR